MRPKSKTCEMNVLASVSVFSKNCRAVKSNFDIQKVDVIIIYKFFIRELDLWVITVYVR